MNLIELGEREIIRKLVEPRVSGLGDDCAVVTWGSDYLVVTTDPVPIPAANVIGGSVDLYWAGWLLVTINASDIAASGAEPLGFLAAIECPQDTSENDFARLLDGIKESCDFHKMAYIGGNIKEAPRFAATGTAFGRCRGSVPLGRAGAVSGQLVALIGRKPCFWRDALLARRGISVEESSPLYKPQAQTVIMQKLFAERLVSASIDNSDGLLPSLQQLGIRSGVAIEVDISALRLSGSAESEVDAARLAMGWGDWNVVCSLDLTNLDRCVALGGECGVDVLVVGECKGGKGIYLRGSTETIVAPRLESERFSKDSWFLEGIEGYIGRLTTLQLPK